jgi:hypothetical protein
MVILQCSLTTQSLKPVARASESDRDFGVPVDHVKHLDGSVLNKNKYDVKATN